MKKVFISHSLKAKDRAWVDRVARDLRAQGYSVSYDDILLPGENWEDVIGEELRNSDLVLALFDQSDATNPNLMFELGAALSVGKRVIPVVRDRDELARVPFRMSKHEFLVADSPEDAAKAVLALN